MPETKKSEENLKLIENFVSALTIEVAESKKKNIEREIILKTVKEDHQPLANFFTLFS